MTSSGCGTAQQTTGPSDCPEAKRLTSTLDSGATSNASAGTPEISRRLTSSLMNSVTTYRSCWESESRMRRLSQQDPGEQNQLSVDLELQADCFAGVWAHSTQQRSIVHEDDIEGALRAAAAVGDDHLQRMSGRAVEPERWSSRLKRAKN